MNWYKVWNGMPEDPKLSLIAKRADLKRGEILAVWVALLDGASRAKSRGSVAQVDAEQVAVALDMEAEAVTRALHAFRVAKMIKDNRVASWDKRQATSTKRVRAFREKQKRKAPPAPPPAPAPRRHFP